MGVGEISGEMEKKGKRNTDGSKAILATQGGGTVVEKWIKIQGWEVAYVRRQHL